MKMFHFGEILQPQRPHKVRSKLDAFLRRYFLQKIGLLAESNLMRLLGYS
jgi:hypothetical protein